MNIWPFSVINGLRAKLDATLLSTAEQKHAHACEVTRFKEHERWLKTISDESEKLLRQEIRALEQQIAEGRNAAGGMYILGGVSEVETADQFYYDVGRVVVGSGGVTVFPNHDPTTPGLVGYRLDVQRPTGRRYEDTIERALEIVAEQAVKPATRRKATKK